MTDAELAADFIGRCFAAGAAWGALCVIAAVIVGAVIKPKRRPYVLEIERMRREQQERGA